MARDSNSDPLGRRLRPGVDTNGRPYVSAELLTPSEELTSEAIAGDGPLQVAADALVELNQDEETQKEVALYAQALPANQTRAIGDAPDGTTPPHSQHSMVPGDPDTPSSLADAAGRASTEAVDNPPAGTPTLAMRRREEDTSTPLETRPAVPNEENITGFGDSGDIFEGIPVVDDSSAGMNRVTRGEAVAAAPATRRRRRRGPTQTITVTQNVTTAPGDPRLNALERQAQNNVTEATRQLFLRSSQLHGDEAAVNEGVADMFEHNQEIYRDVVNRQMNTARQTLAQLNSLNQAVMDRRMDPTRFFSSRGSAAGFSAAASVAMGVLGQALAPGTENAALSIIRRAIDRDMEAQVQDFANARAGVTMARTLYSDLVSLFGDERVAMEALRTMYQSEATARIEALRQGALSDADRIEADKVIHELALERAQGEAEAARLNSLQTLNSVITATTRPGTQLGQRLILQQRRSMAPVVQANIMDAYQRLGLEVPEHLRPQQPGARPARPGGRRGGRRRRRKFRATTGILRKFR